MSAQREDALEAANANRAEVALLRARLRSGALSLGEVMADPPAALRNFLLIDVIRWSRTRGYGATITEIGRMALRDGVNLTMPVGRASAHSRAWVAEHGTRGVWKAKPTPEQRADRRRMARELYAACGSYAEVGRALQVSGKVARSDCRSAVA